MMTDKTICKKASSLALVFALKSEAKNFINFFNKNGLIKKTLFKSSRTELVEWVAKKPFKFCNRKISKLYTFICGVGKVNAAIAISQLVFEHQVNWLLNIGVVGITNHKIPLLTPLLVDKACYHDFDLTPFNYAYGQVPGMKDFFKSSRALNEIIINEFKKNKKSYCLANLASGDKFVSKNESKPLESLNIKPDAIDMEIASILHMASLYNIHVSSIKFGSDYINKTDNKNQYEQSLKAYPSVIDEIINLLFSN